MNSVLTLLKIAHEGRGSLAGPRAHRRGGASEGRSRGGSIGDKSVEDELAGSMGLKSSPSSRGGRHYWGSHMDCGGWGGSLTEEQDFSDLRVPALEESFTCFLSGRILRCPVTLPCGHSFSRDALEEYVGEGDGEEKEGRLLGTTPGEGGGVGPMPVRGVGGERDDGSLGDATQGTGASPTSAGEGKARGGEGGQRGGRRCCPLPECGRAFVASGPLSVNRALDEIIARCVWGGGSRAEGTEQEGAWLIGSMEGRWLASWPSADLFSSLDIRGVQVLSRAGGAGVAAPHEPADACQRGHDRRRRRARGT